MPPKKSLSDDNLDQGFLRGETNQAGAPRPSAQASSKPWDALSGQNPKISMTLSVPMDIKMRVDHLRRTNKAILVEIQAQYMASITKATD